MAENWIKMRTSLQTHPKVIGVAQKMAQRDAQRDAQHSVTAAQRNVTRFAVIGALCVVWGNARMRGEKRGEDLAVDGVTLDFIDDTLVWPGFGEALQSVGWAVQNAEGVVFPGFFVEHNAEVTNKKKSAAAAERQARYRERQREKAASDAQRDAQRNASHDAQQPAQRDAQRDDRERERERERLIEEANASSCPQALQPADRTDKSKGRRTVGLKQLCTTEEAFCSVPVIGHDEQWRLPLAKLQEWQATFPGVNVEQAACEAVQWLIDNPSKRKTPKGILRFFNAWLSKEQDRGPRQLFRTNYSAPQDRAITREQHQHAVLAHVNAIAAHQQQARLTDNASGGG